MKTHVRDNTDTRALCAYNGIITARMDVYAQLPPEHRCKRCDRAIERRRHVSHPHLSHLDFEAFLKEAHQ
jgi:hypothetical protein